MNGENDVRVLLAEVESPPSRVDVERAVADGRRVERHRRYARIGGLTAVAVALAVAVPVGVAHRSAPPAGPVGPPPVAVRRGAGPCTVQRLATAGLGNLVADRVDPTGRYVGGARVVGHDDSAVLWTDGVPALLPVPSAAVAGVNAHGTVVGLAQDGGGAGYAWVSRDGVLTRLVAPPGYPRVTPAGINAAGTVVGFAYDASGGHGIAIRWTVGRYDRPEVLTGPDDASAHGVDDDGTVVGSAGGAAYRWDAAGHGSPLALPAGMRGGTAESIRGDWIVGEADDPAAIPTPVRWNRRTGAVERLPGRGFGLSVNAAGTAVVQGGWDNTVVDPTGHPRTLDQPAGVSHALPWAVADDGTVVGYVDGGGPLRWRCG